MSWAVEIRYQEFLNEHQTYNQGILVQTYALMGYAVAFQVTEV